MGEQNSRKPWIIGCSIAVGVFILLCALIGLSFLGLFGEPVGREVSARTSLQNFCQAMLHQEYDRAYDGLSSAAKRRIGSVNQFKHHMVSLDQSLGIITLCDIDPDTLRASANHSDGQHMSVYVYVYRGNNTSPNPDSSNVSVQLSLIREHDSWQVDTADPANVLF